MNQKDIYKAMVRNKAKKIFADEWEQVKEKTWNLCKKYDTENKRRDKILLTNFITIELEKQFGNEIENLFRSEWQEEVDIFCKKYSYSI